MSQCKIIDADILLEFLELSLNTILYHRKLYPKEVFIKKKVYGIPVNISQHPELNYYIKNILVYIKTVIQEDKNNIKSINLLFLKEHKIPIEKFTFCLDYLFTDEPETDSYFVKIEETLRTLYLKLSMLEIYLKPLPKNSSFVINIVTNYDVHISQIENSKYINFPWIIDENCADEVKNGQLIPIHNLKINYLLLQCYVIKDKKYKVNK